MIINKVEKLVTFLNKFSKKDLNWHLKPTMGNRSTPNKIFFVPQILPKRLLFNIYWLSHWSTPC